MRRRGGRSGAWWPSCLRTGGRGTRSCRPKCSGSESEKKDQEFIQTATAKTRYTLWSGGQSRVYVAPTFNVQSLLSPASREVYLLNRSGSCLEEKRRGRFWTVFGGVRVPSFVATRFDLFPPGLAALLPRRVDEESQGRDCTGRLKGACSSSPPTPPRESSPS